MKEEALKAALEYIESWLPYKFERTDIPGMSVAIAHKGKVVFSKAYGYADVESKTEMTTGHIFRIASHSKTFTAVAIMQLQEKGKLRLDDPIVDYLPWLNEHKDKRWQKVTIRQLLSHSAGVIRDGQDADYWGLMREFPNEAEFNKEILASKLVFDTNTKQKYSNYGFTLLGQIVSSVSGETYNDYVTRNIIKHLSLDNTSPEMVEAELSKYATGYSKKEPKDRLPIEHVSTNAMSAATGFCSTAENVCTYFSAHFLGTEKLLSDESKKEMQKTQGIYKKPDGTYDEYGLGLVISYQDGRRLFGHSGGFPGYITKTYCDPENQFVVTVLINCLNAPSYEAAEGIYSVLYKYMNSSKEKPKHNIDKLKGRFISLWSACDIVPVGDEIYAASPEVWQPFNKAEELEYVNAKTLKIAQANMGSSPGELVVYEKDGHIRYAGFIHKDEKTYYKELASKKKIKIYE